jgi:TDG/mug DNA glycosylase family protein
VISIRAKGEAYRPEWVAVVGIGAYHAAFGRPKAVIGPQLERIGSARLPQPSGLNANHQMPELTAAFRELREAGG